MNQAEKVLYVLSFYERLKVVYFIYVRLEFNKNEKNLYKQSACYWMLHLQYYLWCYFEDEIDKTVDWVLIVIMKNKPWYTPTLIMQ